MNQLMPTPRRPALTIYPNGRIEISSRIARRLALQRGDVIGFTTDPPNLYITVTRRAADSDTSSFSLRVKPSKLTCKSFRCYCKAITDRIRSLYLSQHPDTSPSTILRFPAGQTTIDPTYGPAINIITHINITQQ